MIEESPLAAKFYRLVHEVHEMSEAVDAFDLDSKSPESMVEWAELLVKEAKAGIELIEFIEKHGDELAYQLGQMSAVKHFRKMGIGREDVVT